MFVETTDSGKVFRGGGGKGRGGSLSAKQAAWVESIAVDAQGYPHIGYSLYLSNDEHRFRLASWNGKRWIDREVAYAGKCLYAREASYTGLITLDPVDPSCVVIATDANPSTGQLAGKHEFYRVRITENDDRSTIKWRPLTTGSKVRNIRPIILRDDNR